MSTKQMNLNDLQSVIHNKNHKEGESDFAKLIARERLLKWSTAKDFWRAKKDQLDCTYNRYSIIEKGTAKPSLNLARKIIHALEIDESTALHAWVRDLMPDNKSKSYFIDLQSTQNIASYRAISITPEQARLFKESPLSNEVASYISSYSYRGVTSKELCKVFSLSKKELQAIIKMLIRTDIIKLNPQNFFEVPKDAWINIPDLSEFREARIRNFVLSIDSHFSSDYFEDITIEQATYRVLSMKQVEMLRKVARSIARWISLLPDDFENGVPYRFFCGGNICKFGKNRKQIVPKERSILDRL